MKKLKLLIIPLLITALLGFGMNSFASLHSKWSSGDLIFYDGATDIFTIKDSTDGLMVHDDMNLTFGDDSDATIIYDETTDNVLEITCSNGIALSGAMAITGNITVSNAAGPVMVDEAATKSNPTLCPNRAEIDTGLGWQSDALYFALGGVEEYSFTTATFEMNANTITEAGTLTANNAAGPTIVDLAATATVPTLCPNKAETDTGIGWQSDVLHVVLGGVDEYSLSTSTFDMNSNTITEAGTVTATNAAGPTVINLAATATVPTLCPNRAETNTGLGWQSDVLHVVLGGADEYNFAATALSTSASDGAALGTASLMWSDLFLASAGVINFNAGDVTLTHASGLLTVAGGTLTQSDTTDATNLTTAALVVAGGIACADRLFVGDDIDMSVNDTGIYDLVLATNKADALSITDGTDIVVFDTSTPRVTITPVTTITGALTLDGGAVIADDQTVAYGTGSDVTESWDNTRGALVTAPSGHFVSPEGISDRFRLTWVAGERGKPAANGDIQNATENVRMIADPNFEVLGTGGGAISVSHYAEGGISLVTDGTVDHGLVLLPHLTANTTAWKEVTWGTDKETRWECSIKTGPAITTCIIWAGLKETNVPDEATDDDKVFFRYEDNIIAGNWQAISSIAGSDDAHDSGVAVAINTVYHLVIEIDSSRVAKFYINGSLVETSAALTDAKDLIPYIGIEEDGASSAMTLYVRGQAISRKFE